MKVLYLEDNDQDADLVRTALRKHAPDIQLDIVATLTEGLARLERFHATYGTPLETVTAAPVNGNTSPGYDLVLADLNLSDGSGKTLLARVRSQNLPLPVVILTGSCREETLVALLRDGADDYIIKRGDFLETLTLVLHAAFNKFHTETFRRTTALRILYVEPNVYDVSLMKQELAAIAPQFKFESLQTAEQVLHRFAAPDPQDITDVLVLDHRLAGASAMDVLKELCQVRKLDLPIILVTGQGDEEIARQSLKLGAADYVVKSAGYLQRLPTVIENAWLRAESSRREHVLMEQRSR
ncbi:MAG: response regulator, partial [Nitrosospira sp.]|nr:response regulator [Nitrosospira sp.]